MHSRAVDQCEHRRLALLKGESVAFGHLRCDFQFVAGGDAEENLSGDIAPHFGGAADDEPGGGSAHVAAAEAGVHFLHLRARGGEARIGGDSRGPARLDGFRGEGAGIADRFGALVLAASAHGGRLRFGDARLRGAGLRLRQIGVEPRHGLADAHGIAFVNQDFQNAHAARGCCDLDVAHRAGLGSPERVRWPIPMKQEGVCPF